MRKLSPFFSFLFIYLGLIFLSLSIHQIFFSEVMDSLPFFNTAIAGSSLTQFNGAYLIESLPPLSYFVFSLIITQVSGIVLLSYLVWYYRKLFGTKKEKEAGLSNAFKLTIIISLISETLLFLFFVYSIPTELTDYSFHKKIITALSLAINSFNNAGAAQLFTPAILEQNFILQIGIIGGSTLGSLGIFVIYELFSPIKLRERLNDPSIDWSYITKISVFGTAFVLLSGSIAFYLIELNNFLAGKNFMESVIASIFEISSARGFGFYLTENTSTSVLKSLISAIGSGSFSTGGGLTLLSLMWIYSLIWKHSAKSTHFILTNSILKNLVIYSLITFIIPTSLLLIIDSDTTVYNTFISQFELFTTNHLTITASSNWFIDLIKGITIIAGRIGFIIACYLTFRQHRDSLIKD